jgi:hypothetical protein
VPSTCDANFSRSITTNDGTLFWSLAAVLSRERLEPTKWTFFALFRSLGGSVLSRCALVTRCGRFNVVCKAVWTLFARRFLWFILKLSNVTRDALSVTAQAVLARRALNLRRWTLSVVTWIDGGALGFASVSNVLPSATD